MIDHLAAQLALRARALTTVAATTGSMTLAVVGGAITRASGSFVTDGFAVGMEVALSGFSGSPAPGVIREVSAGTMKLDRTLTNASASGGRTVTAGIPAGRAFENIQYTPTTGRPYVVEQYVPATQVVRTWPASESLIEETGLYVLSLYGLADTGLGAIRKLAGAVLERFGPGLALTAGSDGVSVRGNPGPWAGQVRPIDGGWAVITITVPWRAFSRNAAVN